jgi:hypothetical protein
MSRCRLRVVTRTANVPGSAGRTFTQTQRNTRLGLLALAVLVLLAPAAVEAIGINIRPKLVATGVDPDARGQVRHRGGRDRDRVGFIVGAPPEVTGQLLDASGGVVVEATVTCEVD